MNKRILEDYVDACELIREIEEELEQLNDKTNVFDKVKGSNPEFPYQPQSFSVQGVVVDKADKEKREFLMQQYSRAVEVKSSVEKWMCTIPLRMQRIIRYKIFERLTWDEVGDCMNEVSGENVRKEYYRFMKKQKRS